MRAWIRIGIALILIAVGAAILIKNSPRAMAEEKTVEIRATLTTGVGNSLGQIQIQTTPYGILFTPELKGLTPGIHGFHVHQHPTCDPEESMGVRVPGLAAGGHFDPERTQVHHGPYGEGHLGDLPPLTADGEGQVSLPVLAPRLELSDLKDRSLIIHGGGDNFSDDPNPLGGGGSRVACGVIRG